MLTYLIGIEKSRSHTTMASYASRLFAHHRLTDDLNFAVVYSEKPVIFGVVHLKVHVPNEEEQ